MDFHSLRKYESYSNYVIAFLFFAITLGWFYGSYDYSFRGAAFPRYISLIAALMCLTILLQNFLPSSVRNVVIGEESGFNLELESGETPDSEQQSKEGTESMKDRLFTASLIGGYLIGIYILGFMIATILYVIIHSLHNKISWKSTIIITLICTISVYAIGAVLTIDIWSSIYDGGIL